MSSQTSGMLNPPLLLTATKQLRKIDNVEIKINK